MGVLVRELAALYGAFRAGQAAPLPELPIQYADYAAWQREWLPGRELAAAARLLEAAARGRRRRWSCPRTARARPCRRYRGARQRGSILPRDAREALKELGARARARRSFMTLLAAFQAAPAPLHRPGRHRRRARRSPAARARETEGLIGFFVNTLVLRADLSGDPTFRELLARVREIALGAYAHQDVPVRAAGGGAAARARPEPHRRCSR